MVKKIDKSLIFVSIIFLVFGLVMILSASSMESYMRYSQSPYIYFFRQIIFVILGIFGYFFVILFPTSFYKKISPFLIIISFLSLVGLTVRGYVANNAASWYKIGPANIQPSEFTKVFLIIFFASYYGKYKNKLNSNFILLFPLFVSIILTVLVAIQPDMGTAFILFCISLFMFYVVPHNNPVRRIITKILFVCVLLFSVVLVVTKGDILPSYQKDRFNFNDPCDRYQDDSGYQLCNSYIAFKNGNLIGSGLGKSTQKYLYLPESYTDFIFPIIVEELGLFGGAFILLLYFILLYRIYKISKDSKSIRCSLLAFGVFVYILLHIIINLAGVMGLLPLTGVPLPFLSYGGSFCISLLISLAIVSRVSIENNMGKKNN